MKNGDGIRQIYMRIPFFKLPEIFFAKEGWSRFLVLNLPLDKK
jgi:hypothetical protein